MGHHIKTQEDRVARLLRGQQVAAGMLMVPVSPLVFSEL